METTCSRGHPDHDACGTGFIVRLGGGATHEVVERALVALQRLSHRGGVDADGLTSDGAGLLTAIPRKMLALAALDHGVVLPEKFGLGMLFIQPGEELRVQAEIKALAASMALCPLGWREVPVKRSILVPSAGDSAPSIWQCFLAAINQSDELDRSLFLLRK